VTAEHHRYLALSAGVSELYVRKKLQQSCCQH